MMRFENCHLWPLKIYDGPSKFYYQSELNIPSNLNMGEIFQDFQADFIENLPQNGEFKMASLVYGLIICGHLII